MKFEKGKSGNPAGRAKGVKNKATRDIKELIQTTVNFKELVIKLSEKAEGGDMASCKLLLEYGFGKPVEIQIAPMTIPSESEQPAQHKHTLDAGTTEELINLARAFVKRPGCS